ncbi:DUF378 domain-containing protein [Candidatus Dependentiae bacterium]|nr:DUF378 domain-containing protein [Candidatus Dependentiae bacterium]
MVTIITWLASFLSAIGAINWGLTKFFKLNLVEYICRMVTVVYLEEILYGTIAICGLYTLLKLFV